MNTTIQVFENSEFGAIRTMSNEQGEPLFCAKDVAVALGYTNTMKAVRDHVEEDDRTKCSLIDSLGREQKAIFINESGLILTTLLEGDDVTKRDTIDSLGREQSTSFINESGLILTSPLEGVNKMVTPSTPDFQARSACHLQIGCSE